MDCQNGCINIICKWKHSAALLLHSYYFLQNMLDVWFQYSRVWKRCSRSTVTVTCKRSHALIKRSTHPPASRRNWTFVTSLVYRRGTDANKNIFIIQHIHIYINTHTYNLMVCLKHLWRHVIPQRREYYEKVLRVQWHYLHSSAGNHFVKRQASKGGGGGGSTVHASPTNFPPFQKQFKNNVM
jgi:hypothetical protein